MRVRAATSNHSTHREGRLTALVGPSGSGKTTLTRLIARFWDVDAGAVRIGGVDVRDMSVDELGSDAIALENGDPVFHRSLLVFVGVGARLQGVEQPVVVDDVLDEFGEGQGCSTP